MPGAIHSPAKAFLGPGTFAAIIECPWQPLRSRYTQPPNLTHLPLPSSPQRPPFLPTAAPPPGRVPGIRHRQPALFFRVRLPFIPCVDSFHSPSGLPSVVCLTSFGSVGTQFWKSLRFSNLCGANLRPHSPIPFSPSFLSFGQSPQQGKRFQAFPTLKSFYPPLFYQHTPESPIHIPRGRRVIQPVG